MELNRAARRDHIVKQHTKREKEQAHIDVNPLTDSLQVAPLVMRCAE